MRLEASVTYLSALTKAFGGYERHTGGPYPAGERECMV
jgi:hypothetical protein